MSQAEKPKPPLKPARPETIDESAGYMPRVPWRWIMLSIMGTATVFGGYWLKEQRKANELRAQIVQVHEEELKPAAERYLGLRDKLEAWILDSAKTVPESWADKRLRIPGLRSGQGLYLRIDADQADSIEHIRAAATGMEKDSIASCLGMAPSSARGLWALGEFLDPSWIDDIREEDRVMQLRVKDEVLSKHIKNALPNVLNLTRADWFMLVLQQGPTRRDDPVDVFLWDLRTNKQLLRARVQAKGMLVPMRLRMGDAPYQPPPTNLVSGGATDCSIASQLKALAGMPAAAMEHGVDTAGPRPTPGATGGSAVPGSGPAAAQAAVEPAEPTVEPAATVEAAQGAVAVPSLPQEASPEVGATTP